MRRSTTLAVSGWFLLALVVVVHTEATATGGGIGGGSSSSSAAAGESGKLGGREHQQHLASLEGRGNGREGSSSSSPSSGHGAGFASNIRSSLAGTFSKPNVRVDEALEPEDQEERDERRKGRWAFVDDSDPVVSVIRSVRDLFPNIRVHCEPTTTLKLRKKFSPLKTVLTLGADYNTNIGVWQFRSSWEDSLIGGRISVAGRELMLSKSWLIKLMDSEDVATRLKLRAVLNTSDWTAQARFGFRTERIMPLNVRDGFTLCRKVPLDGPNGHAKLEVITRFSLPEPEIQLSTSSDENRGVVAGMGDVHVGVDELNLLLMY